MIFNDPIVDNGESFFLIEMGMSVFLIRDAVCGPAGVSDRRIEAKLAAGEHGPPADLEWRDMYLTRQRRCEELAGEAVTV